jgi:hypothetical protein
MATRAQQFKSEAQRRKRAEPPLPEKGPEQRRPTPDSGARNLKGRAEKKATVVTEVSLSGQPSRKSSRASSHHGKNSTVLEYVARQRSFSPQHRHGTR